MTTQNTLYLHQDLTLQQQQRFTQAKLELIEGKGNSIYPGFCDPEFHQGERVSPLCYGDHVLIYDDAERNSLLVDAIYERDKDETEIEVGALFMEGVGKIHNDRILGYCAKGYLAEIERYPTRQPMRGVRRAESGLYVK